MTKAQERAVERIRRQAKQDLFFGDKCEFKLFEVDENPYFVSVVVEVGMIGDEGTLASAFCRYHCQLFIGKRGGIRYPYHGRKGWTYRRFTGGSMLTPVIDQRI